MEAKETIESGSLELYVMGALPLEETGKIEELRKTHPEVNEEIMRIERAMIGFAELHAEKPKPELKEEIAKRIGLGIELDLEEENIKTIIVHLRPLMRWGIAAALFLIVGLSLTTLYFYNRFDNANEQIAELKERQQVLANQIKYIITEDAKIKTEVGVVSNASYEKIMLTGLPLSPSSHSVVFWNRETGSTYINSALLPSVGGKEQFQLWAIVDGKPVDLGVINKQEAFSEMKTIKEASAFAITLEPVGGSATPTLEKMYVMGKV